MRVRPLRNSWPAHSYCRCGGPARRSDPAAERALERECRKAGIEISKNTTAELTLPVELFLGEDRPRPTVSRRASTLRLAREEKVKPQGFVAFVREMGATAACARLLAQRRKAAADVAKNSQSAAMKPVEERLAGAPKIRFPKELGLGDEDLIAPLVKPGADGSCAVLGQREVAASAVGTFTRIAAKPTGGVVRRRR